MTWDTLISAVIAAAASIGVLLVLLKRIRAEARWKGKVDADRKAFKIFMKEVRKKLDTLIQAMPPPLVTRLSPVRLTEFGQKISQKIDAAEWAQQAASDMLDDELREKISQDPLKVQEESASYVKKLPKLEEPFRTRARTCAYENGIAWEQLLNVLAIELRDALLVLVENEPPKPTI